LVLQLAASGELLHRRLSRNEPRELDLIPPHDIARAREHVAVSRRRISLRRGPSKHDGRRESKDGNRGAHAHGPNVPWDRNACAVCYR
jgi:hypothetical protein